MSWFRRSNGWHTNLAAARTAARMQRVDGMSAEYGPHRCTVLVIDDDAEARDLLSVALTADGVLTSTRSATAAKRCTISARMRRPASSCSTSCFR